MKQSTEGVTVIPMSILILGSKGQLGTELNKILQAGASELGAIPEALKHAHVTAWDIADLDISDRETVIQKLGTLKPHIIINCAAYTNVDGCETDPDTAFKVNALGPRNLAVAAAQQQALLIHISTDYVFAGDGSAPYREWDICNPQSIYGQSKYLGEQYVMQFCTRYAIVRTSWLYGYEGGNFVKTIIKAAQANGQLKVVDDQRGNPTNAADLVHHILKIAAAGECGIFHCTGAGECSWYDFAVKIVEYAGIPCTTTPCTTAENPRPARRPAYSALDNMMLRATVGDEMRPWEEALRNFINNYESGQ